MPRNLPPRIQSHITRAQRRRFIAASLFGLCVLVGTGAALAQTQLPHQLVATLKPVASELRTQFAQLPSALSARMPKVDLQPPTALAAASEAATSVPTYIAEKVRTFFCRIFGCDTSQTTSRISHENLAQQPTKRVNANQPAPTQPPRGGLARSATTSELVVSSASPASSNSSVSAPASSPSSASPAPVTQNPVIERVREVHVAQPDTAYVDARLAALEASIAQRMAATENANATSFRSASSGSSPTSVAASTITGMITNAIDTVSAAISSLTATEVVATNATTTNLYVSGTATIGGATGLLRSNSGVVSTLANGSNGQVLKVVGGALEWSTDLTGGGGGASAWATTSDDLALYPADTTDVLLIGTSATSSTGNILEVSGNSLLRGSLTAYNAITAPTFTATSSTATSTFPRLNVTGSLGLGSDYITDLTGSGLTIASGALTLDASGDWSGTFDGLEGSAYLANAFSTTSVNYWKSVTDLFSTSSATYWKSVTDFFSTSSALYFASTGLAFSTTSADFWETQQSARTADDLTNNSIEDLQDVAAITENYGDLLYWNGSSWADIATSSLGLPTSATLASYLALSDWYATTSDALDEGGTNRYFTDARVQTYLDTIGKGYFFSTTSADYWKSVTSFFSTSSASYFASVGLAFSTTSNDYWQSQRNFFSTTSAQYFAHSSTTIPKTYTANTFAGLQTFANASTSILSASTLCLSTDCRTSWPTAGSSFDYPFPGNATSTTLAFNGGLLSVGSTTIAGNATTTGMLGVASIFIGNSRFTSLLGTGLLNTSGRGVPICSPVTVTDWSGATSCDCAGVESSTLPSKRDKSTCCRTGSCARMNSVPRIPTTLVPARTLTAPRRPHPLSQTRIRPRMSSHVVFGWQ